MVSSRQAFAGFAAGIALVCVLACVTMWHAQTRRVAMVTGFPQSDLDMLKVMQSMAPKSVKTQMTAQKAAPVKAEKKGLTMQQQYARIMQNQGYFSPWSRQNTWNNRIAINNIRKANTPEV